MVKKNILAAIAGNNGLLLENLVFKELYLKFGNIYTDNICYYAESSGECDFVIYREGGIALPVQVSWTLTDPDTKNREIKGLLRPLCTVRLKKPGLSQSMKKKN